MNEKFKNIIRKVLFLIFLCVFIYSLFNIYTYFADYHNEKELYKDTQNMVQIDSNKNPNDITIGKPTTVVVNKNHWILNYIHTQNILKYVEELEKDKENENPNNGNMFPTRPLPPIIEPIVDIYKDIKIKIDVDWETLKSEAKHLVGWLYIPNTNINYPLVQHPTDNQYYLNRNYKGKWTSNGSIFVRKETLLDSKNPIIYGHRMNADIMFHQLLSYRKQEFADTHKYIYIATEDNICVYQVFSVVYSDYWEDHFTWVFNKNGEMSFMDYIEQEISSSIITTDTREITADDKIISLATCSGRTNVNRIIVHAVLLTTYTLDELNRVTQDDNQHKENVIIFR